MLPEDADGGGGENHHPMIKKPNKKPKLNRTRMDWISDLPEPILHHIMSFLPIPDITRVSILSKRFFSIWRSYPVLFFDQQSMTFPPVGMFSGSGINEFLDYMQNSVRLRRINTVLSEFRVKANLFMDSSEERFDSVILFALETGVRSVDLNVGSGLVKYNLPGDFGSRLISVLRLKGFSLDLNAVVLGCPLLESLSLDSCLMLNDIKISSKTLKSIKLWCCSVSAIEINAPRLQFFEYLGDKNPKPCRINVLACKAITFLLFQNVATGSGWVEQHVCELGNLETFILSGCQDIESITVRNRKVERVEINNCAKLGFVQITAPSLCSFEYIGADENRSCNISFVAAKHIKEISIEGAGITDEWVENQLAASCYLKRLKLISCLHLRRIGIFHQKLRSLELISCIGLIEAEVDTPQLLSFVYSGQVIVFGTVVTRSICTAVLTLRPPFNYNDDWYHGLRNMLSYFGHCKALKLKFNCNEALIIPQDVRENLVPPLYDLKVLEIDTKPILKIETEVTELVDSLLWLSPHPDSLCISSLSSHLQMKFLYDGITDEQGEEMDPFCCRSKPIKCWRHNLRKVEIHYNNRKAKEELQYYFHKNALRFVSIC